MKQLVSGLILFLSFQNCVIAMNNQIDTYESVQIQDTEQVIRIKGADISNPILLYLNGGPGDTVLDQMDNLFDKLQKKYTVVLWDQRKTGRSKKSTENSDVSHDILKQDTYCLVKYLLKKFNREQLIIVAHSYGTSLGFYMAQNYPELIETFIASNPMVQQLRSEELALEYLIDKAKNDNNSKAIKELTQVSVPFETSTDLYYARKWLFLNEGKRFAKKKWFRKRIEEWTPTWLKTFNVASKQNLFKENLSFNCPIYFILGGKDYQTNSGIAKGYFELINSPKKDIVTINSAGHLIPFENNDKFQKTILQFLN